MKTGQIIRRKTNGGIPIGPYLRIVGFKTEFVEAERLDSKSGITVFIERTRVYEPGTMNLILSDKIMDRIKIGQQRAIIHDLSPKWRLLKERKPEVILLRSIKYSQKVVIFSVQEIRTSYYNRQPQVRVEFAEMLYKHD